MRKKFFKVVTYRKRNSFLKRSFWDFHSKSVDFSNLRVFSLCVNANFKTFREMIFVPYFWTNWGPSEAVASAFFKAAVSGTIADHLDRLMKTDSKIFNTYIRSIYQVYETILNKPCKEVTLRNIRRSQKSAMISKYLCIAFILYFWTKEILNFPVDVGANAFHIVIFMLELFHW